jgi:hypothetical protein
MYRLNRQKTGKGTVSGTASIEHWWKRSPGRSSTISLFNRMTASRRLERKHAPGRPTSAEGYFGQLVLAQTFVSLCASDEDNSR